MLDSFEFGLYKLEAELVEKLQGVEGGARIEIVALLGSIGNRLQMEHAIETFEVDTLYHAAAYKQVPMVEKNVVEGVQNNIFGTLVSAQAAEKFKVKNFVLISTDKAVRPTNVMGATKRFAEQVLQAMAVRKSSTKFSMVRFGNVLGSSGSVVPAVSTSDKHWWAGYCDPSGGYPLFHDGTGSCAAGYSGWLDGKRWRRLRPRHA